MGLVKKMKDKKVKIQISVRYISIAILLVIISSLVFTSCFAENEKDSINEPIQQKQEVTENKGKDKEQFAEINNSDKKEQKLVEIFDGRIEDRKENEATKSETKMIAEEFKRNEAVIMKKSEFECDDEDVKGVTVIGTAVGSFTKADSQQKVFLYERCRAGRNFGIGGVIIYEGEKVVLHYVYGDNGLESGIFATKDFNKNGLSEIVLIGFGMGQGYSAGAIDIFEIKEGNLEFLGKVKTYDDNSGAVLSEDKIETIARMIYVQPSKNPVFYQDVYEKKGKATKWSLTQKSEKISLSKEDAVTFLKIK